MPRLGRILLAAIIPLIATSHAWAAPERLVTVGDIVEAADVYVPPRSSAFLYSADGNRVAFVLRRPNIASNKIAFELYVVDRMRGAAPLRPIHVASSSNDEPAISGLRWSRDGGSVSFVEAMASNSYRLLNLSMSGETSEIARESAPILAYDFTDEVVVLALHVSTRVDEDEQVRVVDRSLVTELGISTRDASSIAYVRRDRAGARAELGSWPVALGRDAPAGIWISPDARKAILLRPVGEAPPAWDAYQHPSRGAGLRAARQSGSHPALLRYALIDLTSGVTEPLLDAPLGDAAFGNPTAFQALWSADSNRVVVVNTALPLSLAGEVPWTRSAAAIAEVSIADHQVRPLMLLPGLNFESDNLLPLVVQNIAASNGRSLDVFARGRSGERLRAEIDRAAPDLDPPSFRPVRGFTISVVQANNVPPRIFEQTDHGRPRMILDPNPAFAHLRFGRAQTHEWVDGNGREWRAGLILPPDFDAGRRYPLVIQTHGYDEGLFQLEGPYTSGFAAQALASRNFVVVQMPDRPELVGSGEVEANLEGYRSLIADLERRGLIDRARIGLIGFSRTSLYVKAALKSELAIAAAAVVDGIDHSYWQYLVSIDLLGGINTRDIEVSWGGPPWGDTLGAWQVHASDLNLDRVHAPLRIVAIGEASLLSEWGWYAGLRRLGRPVELNLIRHDQHVLVRPSSRVAASAGNVDWFDFWLNGREDPKVRKSEQYQRWRQLRERASDRQNQLIN